RRDELVRGELRPGGTEREWCDPEVLRRLRRASLAALRREVEPVEQAAFGRFLPSWHGVGRRASLREGLVPLQGLALPVSLWESDVLPCRVPGYRPEQLDALSASGEVVWVGAGLDRVALFFREDAPALGPPPAADRPEREVHERLRAALGRSALFWFDLLADTGLETVGLCRRGYFVESLGGAQFALGGAVERLRELRPKEGEEAEPLVLAAADAAQPYGAALPWPKRAGARAARVAGAYVVLLGGEAALFVERGGRSLVPLREPEDGWLREALSAFVE